jgi:hypothetical protein
MIRVDTTLLEGATSLSIFIYLIYYLVVVCLFCFFFFFLYIISKNPFTLANKTFVLLDLQSRDPSKI